VTELDLYSVTLFFFPLHFLLNELILLLLLKIVISITTVLICDCYFMEWNLSKSHDWNLATTCKSQNVQSTHQLSKLSKKLKNN
jgi:hypothetical protein